MYILIHYELFIEVEQLSCRLKKEHNKNFLKKNVSTNLISPLNNLEKTMFVRTNILPTY